MPSFWSYVCNEKYNIGCTGQTVYVYKREGEEVGRFRDLIYAYLPIISPCGDIFVVKSTDGRIAVYSLETLSLVKKFRFSKVDGAQDDGGCFSPDGSVFYNIERQSDSTRTALSLYNTADFSLKKRILDQDPNLVLSAIQFEKDEIFILYLMHKKLENEDFENRFFVAKLIGEEIRNPFEIPEKIFNYYCGYLDLANMGFTKKAKEWSVLKYEGYDLSTIQDQSHTLAELWNRESAGVGAAP